MYQPHPDRIVSPAWSADNFDVDVFCGKVSSYGGKLSISLVAL